MLNKNDNEESSLALTPGDDSLKKNSQAGSKKDKAMLTIEEHKKNHGIDDSVFQAVIQYKGWAGGKKIPEAVFADAVQSFLGASMGGV